ncbi:MAG: ATP-binding protein [Mariprofundaceae bacterium]|nr:ATP-binding protein [Mariprofundaceae bacterium]
MANKQVPDSNSLIHLENGERIAKVMTVLGHNASGKTKLLMPLSFITWFMAESFKGITPDEDIPVEAHRASDSKIISFEFEFTMPSSTEHVFRYELELSTKQVFREALYMKQKRFNYVFIREWDKETEEYHVKQKGFGLKPSEAKKVRKNVSLISTAAQYGVPFAEALVNFSGCAFTNVNMAGKRHLDERELNESTKFYYDNEDFLGQLNMHIQRLDFGIEKITIEKVVLPDETEKLIPIFHHKSQGKGFALSIYNESSGTRGIYSILSTVLSILEVGGIAVLDEMESELHPQMVLEIMRMFTDSDSNPNDAQLLMATHSLEVLQRVEKNQIYLVEKNDCVSEAWRLDEMKGVRRDENIYARYMAGAYGAVPNID